LAQKFLRVNTATLIENDFPLPLLGTADLHGPIGLEAHGLEPRGTVRWNYETPELQQHAMRRGEGDLSAHGAVAQGQIHRPR